MARETTQHPNTLQRVRAVNLGFGLDWWSVIAALGLAGLVLSGLLPQSPW